MLSLTRNAAACAALSALALATACGGGSPSAPVAVVAGGTASPSPTPAPSPSPSPVAVATPTPSPEASPEINDNDMPVDRVTASVYYVDCDGKIQEHSRNAEEVASGCRAHLDATAKDEFGVPTNPRYPVQWRYSNPGALDVRGSNPMGPIVTAKFPHDQTIYVHVDGIDSNKFSVRFN